MLRLGVRFWGLLGVAGFLLCGANSIQANTELVLGLVPYQTAPRELKTPIYLGADFRALVREEVGIYLTPRLVSVGVWGKPLLESDGGFALYRGAFRGELGLEAHHQTFAGRGQTLKDTPYRGSAQGIQGSAAYAFGWISPMARVRYLEFDEVSLGSREGKTTYFHQKDLFVIELGARSPSAQLEDWPGPFFSLNLALYSFGTAGVASQEFATTVDSNDVGRARVGLGWSIGSNAEAWLLGQAVFHVVDREAHRYQAALLGADHLMASRSLIWEGRWKF